MKREDSSLYILKKLTAFSVPLILSGLLQQLFNWVDALIVGNLVGETALGGVGATSSVYNLFVTVLVGFTSGLSVLFAQQFGQEKHEENRNLLAGYSVLLTAAFALVAAFGIAFIDPALELMDTPSLLFASARDYLRIILMGVPFLALYNTYSALLRGVGNSTVPFIAVLISSVTNAVLDYVFIAFFHLGVSGAAAATVISQIAMTLYVIFYTVTRYPAFRFSLLRMRQYRGSMRKGGAYALPPAVQSSVSSVGNVILQRFMNGFGEQTVAAITTAYRIDTVLLLPIINFSTAISTLVAQETGAGRKEAAEKIFKLGSLIMALLSVSLTAVILLLGKTLMAMFGLTAASVAIGERFFHTIAMFYVIYGLSMSIKGYLEGTSDMLFSGIAGICALLVRILCSYRFASIWGNMVIAYAEAFSWLFLLLLFFSRYLMRKKKQRNVGA